MSRQEVETYSFMIKQRPYAVIYTVSYKISFSEIKTPLQCLQPHFISVLPPLLTSSHTSCPIYRLTTWSTIYQMQISCLEWQVVNKFVTCVRYTCNLERVIFL